MKPVRALLGRKYNRKAIFYWGGYAVSIGLVLIVTLISYTTQPSIISVNIVMFYILCVVLVALFWGLGPSTLACVLSVLAHDFFFIEPLRSLGPPITTDLLNLVVLLVIGITISYLAARVRRQINESISREKEAHALYLMSRNLAITNELDAGLRSITDNMKKMLDCDVIFFLPDPHKMKVLKPHPASISPTISEKAIAAATWSFQNRERAGQGTNMFPDVSAFHLPLVTAREVIGVMSVSSAVGALNKLTPEEDRLIKTIADLAALSIERVWFAEETRNIKMSQAATQKLQTALLDSISHDLRTPLSSVLGVLSSLQEELDLSESTKKNLIQVAYEEAERLNSSITNLLDVSRIEAGAIMLSRQPCDIQDIISVALDQLGSRHDVRTIKVNVAEEIPYVYVDFGLIVKVLLNLIDNAVKYSLSGSPIEITARQVADGVEVAVADRGTGIPPQDLPHVFSRFFRVPNTSMPGIGLGLSICKGIVEAHGGHIIAENRPDGGTIIRLTLPTARANM